VYFSKLNFLTALDYYQQAADIFESQLEIDTQGLADINYSISNTLFNLRKFDEAILIIEDNKEKSYSDTKLFYLSLKSAIYQELRDFEKAYNSYQETIEYAKIFYSEKDLNLAFEYINLSIFLISNNKLNEANDYLDLALSIFNFNDIKEGYTFSLYLKTMGFYHESLIVETKNLDDFRSQKSSNLTKAIDYYLKGIEALGMAPDRLSDATYALENTYSLTQSLELLNLIANAHTQISDIYSNTTHPLKQEAI